MTAVLVTLWMLVAAIGGGLVILRAAGLLAVLNLAERLAIGFVLGIGAIGWLTFFAGVAEVYAAPAFIAILLPLTLGLVYVKSPIPAAAPRIEKMGLVEWALISAILVVALMDVMEALAPAADADSMAYHFETPRLFLAEHRIFAIPRAIDGVTQLLLQLTYGMAEGLGGKKAVPLWTMVSGWSPGILLYVLARRHVCRAWALAGALILMTTPAVIYAAGSGQVEVRAAAFALVAAYGAAVAVQNAGDRRISYGWVIIAGLAAGFFIGSKMTGLIFATAAGLILIGTHGSFARLALYAGAALLAGSQWYIFNWSQTGDPIYPLLWQYVTLNPGFEWDAGMAEQLKTMWEPPNAMPRSPLWYVAYPVRSIIAPLPEFGALRTGLGPAALLLAPFACVAAFRTTTTHRSPLFRVMLCSIIFYTIWFFTTPTTLVRLLLPVYPLIVLCMICGAARFTAALPPTRLVIWSGIVLLVLIQIAGQAVFTKKFAAYLFAGQSETEFLKRNISGYDVVLWLNEHLSETERVMVTHRDWLYLLEPPHFMAHPRLQSQVQIAGDDSKAFARQLATTGITHVVVADFDPAAPGRSPLWTHMQELDEAGCARQLTAIDIPIFASRTLPRLGAASRTIFVFGVEPETCFPS